MVKPTSRLTFTDGYGEWTWFDEDGSKEESSADVTKATVAPGAIDVSMYQDADPVCIYEVRLEPDGDVWRGRFRRLVDGRPHGGGTCNARVLPAPADERRLEGRWVEHDKSYKWSLLLRAPSKR